MAAPDYVDNFNASAVATAIAGTVKQMIDGSQFGLESLRMGHQQAMSQFGPIAAAAQRTVDESGSGRARDMQQAPVSFIVPKTA